MSRKGASLEELVRGYFARQGFFALRSVSYRFEDDEITDIDVWLYGRQSASVRTRTIVDVKDKRSPKAFERIVWVRGMQTALGCDRAIVATTDGGQKVVRFAHQQRVSLLSKGFIERLQEKLDVGNRLTLEQFLDNIELYKEQKQDGDWIRRLSDAKSAVISMHGYPAFNKTMAAFRFFGERANTRPHNREQALRCSYFSAALACIALDAALERVVYEDHGARYRAILHGVAYGDAGDARVQNSINTVLEVIGKGMTNGRVIARQARETFEKMFEGVRADIVAEYFTKEHNSAALVSVAKELDERAHASDLNEIQTLSVEAKSILGVFADFVQVGRGPLVNGKTHGGTTQDTTPHEPNASSETRASDLDPEAKLL